MVDVTKFTMKIVDGEIVRPEMICNCGNEMEDVSEYNGLGGIIKRPGGKVKGKL
jgi:hypothetical protein